MRAIIWREIKLHYTKPYWLIANFLPPLFYLAFFGLLFSRAITLLSIDGKNFSYLQFFIPGLIVIQSFSIFSSTLALVNLDRRMRIIEIIHSSTTTFLEYHLGRALSVQLLALLKFILLISTALVFIKLPLPGLHNWIFIFIVFIASNLFWFNLGFVVGLLIRTEDIRDIILQLIILPLSFLSNIYYPINNAPPGLKSLILINPLTHITSLIRPLLLSIKVSNYYAIAVLLGCVVFSTIFCLIIIQKEKQFL